MIAVIVVTVANGASANIAGMVPVFIYRTLGFYAVADVADMISVVADTGAYYPVAYITFMIEIIIIAFI